MPLEASEDQEENDIIIALNRLRLCRQRFNSEIDLREQGLYQRLSDRRSLELDNIPNPNPIEGILCCPPPVSREN